MVSAYHWQERSDLFPPDAVRRVSWNPVVLFIHCATIGADDSIDFDRDIVPIFAEHCFACHGPDAKTREADLRLDLPKDAFRRLPSGHTAIVPGRPKASAVITRIRADDDERMPPSDHGPPLTKSQILTLSRWIEQGAQWNSHWAYQTPRRAALSPQTGVNQPIDCFVRERLTREGGEPSRAASKRTLLRRASLALVGLPPTLDQHRQFFSDTSPDAYERLIDRLMASPHYGEHMAIGWLDLARYADTHGYHMDSHRDMWRWRDWVIDALNRGDAFNQFTIEQLAGDLLPKATLEQRLATAFHRNTMINFENGAIPEEYLNEYVVDRVNTTATVWLGQTFRCARCHDHKYDPFSQRDFYALYAFFNNVPEKGLDGNYGTPRHDSYTNGTSSGTVHDYDKTILDLTLAMDRRARDADDPQRTWEQTVIAAGDLAKLPGGMLLYNQLRLAADSPVGRPHQPTTLATAWITHSVSWQVWQLLAVRW